MLFIKETFVSKDIVTEVSIKTYRVDTYFNNCADKIKVTQQLFIMVCTKNGEIAIFRRSDMMPLVMEAG